MKLKGGIVNSHILNQLIRVYTGACKVENVKDEHVEAYCRDAWELYLQMKESADCEVSIEVLNSLLQLYCVAVKPHDIEAKVLPEYEQNKIKYDSNTYANLAKLQLNLRDLDQVVRLFDRS